MILIKKIETTPSSTPIEPLRAVGIQHPTTKTNKLKKKMENEKKNTGREGSSGQIVRLKLKNKDSLVAKVD